MPEGGRVVAHVGGVHAAHAEDGGDLAGLGRRLGPGQPGLGRPAAAGLHLDEAQLAVGGHGRLAVAGLLASRTALSRTTAPSSSRPRTLWTSAPPSAPRPGPATRGRGRRPRRRRPGAASRSRPGRRRPRWPPRPASSWLVTAARPLAGRPRGEPAGASAASRSAGDASIPSSRRRRSSHTATWRRAAARSPETARLRTSSSWLPSSRGLRARARAVRHGLGRLPGRQPGQRRLAQPRLGHGGEPVALHHQPRLEHRAAGDGEAVEQARRPAPAGAPGRPARR